MRRKLAAISTDRPGDGAPSTSAGDDILARTRPETAAGGYARDDSSVAYYQRINALLEPSMALVDLGAGRGTQLLGDDDFRRNLMVFQHKVQRVIGLDVDRAIEDHPFLDERHLITADGTYPLADASVDIVVADWVLEHVAHPSVTAREIDRILKPGGWFCARTPNRWGYVAMAARLVPNSLHVAVLKRAWPERQETDVFPTVYAFNTLAVVRRHFPEPRWTHHSYIYNPTPKYHYNRRWLFALVGGYQAVVPPFLGTDLHVFVQKRR